MSILIKGGKVVTASDEAVADVLVELGHDPQRVKTERFGGS